MDEGFRKDLLNAKTPEEFLSMIDKKEAEKDAAEAAEPAVTGYKVLLLLHVLQVLRILSWL